MKDFFMIVSADTSKYRTTSVQKPGTNALKNNKVVTDFSSTINSASRLMLNIFDRDVPLARNYFDEILLLHDALTRGYSDYGYSSMYASSLQADNENSQIVSRLSSFAKAIDDLGKFEKVYDPANPRHRRLFSLTPGFVLNIVSDIIIKKRLLQPAVIDEYSISVIFSVVNGLFKRNTSKYGFFELNLTKEIHGTGNSATFRNSDFFNFLVNKFAPDIPILFDFTDPEKSEITNMPKYVHVILLIHIENKKWAIFGGRRSAMSQAVLTFRDSGLSRYSFLVHLLYEYELKRGSGNIYSEESLFERIADQFPHNGFTDCFKSIQKRSHKIAFFRDFPVNGLSTANFLINQSIFLANPELFRKYFIRSILGVTPSRTDDISPDELWVVDGPLRKSVSDHFLLVMSLLARYRKDSRKVVSNVLKININL
jgi:hypothetical protein